MPFNYLLTNLLVDVPTALGAIFLDDEGEAIEFVTRHGDPFELKVEGAYHSIFKRQVQQMAEVAESGAIRTYVLSSSRLCALTCILREGYYVTLILERGGPLSRAVYHLERVASVLEREIV